MQKLLKGILLTFHDTIYTVRDTVQYEARLETVESVMSHIINRVHINHALLMSCFFTTLSLNLLLCVRHDDVYCDTCREVFTVACRCYRECLFDVDGEYD